MKKLSKVQTKIMAQLQTLKAEVATGCIYAAKNAMVQDGEMWFRCFGARQDTLQALESNGVLKSITIQEGMYQFTFYAEINNPVLVEVQPEQTAKEKAADEAREQAAKPEASQASQTDTEDFTSKVCTNPDGFDAFKALLHSTKAPRAKGLDVISRRLGRLIS